MENLYDLVGVSQGATVAEIENKIENEYNQWRKLVTHHDPQKVGEANERLRILEVARETLLNATNRTNYDASLSGGKMGGLGDISYQTKQAATPPSLGLSTASQKKSLNPWQCPTCQTQNMEKTKFCKSCGFELASSCPNCRNLVDYQSQFCSECGIDISHAKHERALHSQHAEKELAFHHHQQQMLTPLRTRADKSFDTAKIGCVLYFIPVLALIAPYFWIKAIREANHILNLSELAGEISIRGQAEKAKKWSRVGLGLYGVFILFGICYGIMFFSYYVGRY